MIPRREFITLIGGAAATWPIAARAQQGDRMRIGVAITVDDAEGLLQAAALRYSGIGTNGSPSTF